VIYIDRKTGAEHQAKARVVVLAASALESVRILLNSGVCQRQRQGRQVHHGYRRRQLRRAGSALENVPVHNEDGADGGHMYVPWWLYKEQLAGKLGFARGYHIEFGGGRTMPGMGTGAGLEWLNGGSYGRSSRKTCGVTTVRSWVSPAAAR
jgi:hypothetical protein